MLVDLLNLVGLPAVDPVLRRAQFNKKVSEMANGVSGVGGNNNNNNSATSNGNSEDAAKKAAAAMASHRQGFLFGVNVCKCILSPFNISTLSPKSWSHRRNVSAETRRFAAIRLAASSTSYQQELSR